MGNKSKVEPSKTLRENFQFTSKKQSTSQSKKLVISLIGYSGAGKGTQGIRLSKLIGIPHISLGDLIRRELREKTKVGWMLEVHDKTYFPEFIPEQIFIGLLIARITEEDCKYGFILDGFPRTALQAKILNAIILKNEDTHVPVFLDVNEEECLKRFKKRYICPVCGHQVGEHTNNVSAPGYCPIDARKGKIVMLVHRPEDQDLADLERRQRLIRENKEPILSMLAQRDPVLILEANNEISPDEIFEKILIEIENVFPIINRMAADNM